MPGPIPDPVSKIVAALLVANGGGVSAALTPLGTWPVYYSEEPTDPDSLIAVADTAPVRGDRTFDGEVYERQGVMIRVRSSNPDLGSAKADALKTLIDGLTPNATYLVGTNLYLIRTITRTTGVTAVGRTVPLSDRLAWTINALVNLRKL